MSAIYYIYKTTNTINNKIYIGSHSSHTLEFDGYFGSGKVLLHAIEKYGKSAFLREIIEVVKISVSKISKEDWDKYVLPIETKWIKYYHDIGSVMYNINKQAAFGGNTTGGTIWIHDPITLDHKMINGEIPEGWLAGRLGNNKSELSNKGCKLYTNNITLEEKWFKVEPCVEWVIGSRKQSEFRKGEGNLSFGKKWYQNKTMREYCYATECPIGFESGHPDWRNKDKFKNESWIKV